MPRLFISRLLETFFRRKWLYLLVLVPFIGLGVLSVSNAEPSYRSTGVIFVDGGVEDTNAGGEEGGTPFGLEAPALFTSRQISNALLTEDFLDFVIANAPNVQDNIDSGALTRDDVRRSISVAAAGDELVSVTATTANPTLSLRLAEGTINGYGLWLLDRADQRQPELHDQSLKTIRDRYATLDEPKEALAPEPHRKQDVLTIVLFTGLGLLVAGVALVVATLLDHSVRYDEEIESRLHVAVLGTVPDSRAAIKPLVL